ncbi:hypothetical protein BBD42_02305 [Paenibacillus sp. BIHB 4019]|uniref:6-phosphogluconolactonase n=1 Tax=Paenibacillus sp. BIHB 4019 TaxID=1870819 RepID=A0A1B2DCJ8_9BACL|nr:lactonase family protein [Paenibacillus sp. BIHB 4019]ANY65429.1 hypothetical protein BBD42_02305 [Paenibacillus sp. BIHB 4019]
MKANKLAGIVYIGCYGSASEPCIYVATQDSESGLLNVIQQVTGIENASFLNVNEARDRLYAVSETAEANGVPGGEVAAYAIDPETGKLSELNRQSTHGEHPCYVSSDGHSVFVANYTGGNAAVLPLAEDGSLQPAAAVVGSKGELGPNASRQDAPHAHAILPLGGPSPYVYITDLGTDSILLYRHNPQGAEPLQLASSYQLNAGAGPRHLALHEQLPIVYVMNELDSTVSVLRKNGEDAGSLELVQTISALPEGFNAYNDAAHIALAPSGKFLYSSNRGHDSIAVFAVNAADGSLTLVQHISCGGEGPRNFALAPDGSRLLVANQKTNHLLSYQVDAGSGRLTPEGELLQISSPVFVWIG